jgi:hypothetical protein
VFLALPIVVFRLLQHVAGALLHFMSPHGTTTLLSSCRSWRKVLDFSLFEIDIQFFSLQISWKSFESIF